MKKATIGSIFIYTISALIIILVVYFGYRGITSIQEANEEAIMEKFQLRMKADISKLAINYGTTASFSYPVAEGYEKLCFVDLHLNVTNEEIRNSSLQSGYPLIWDSVESKSPNNAFLLGKKFLAFDTGKIKVECEPFVYCINITRTTINFVAEGGGDSVIIQCE